MTIKVTKEMIDDIIKTLEQYSSVSLEYAVAVDILDILGIEIAGINSE